MFDASTVLAYAKGSVAVGEILAELLDTREGGEDVSAALPAVSLLAAVDSGNARDLYRLTAHPAVWVWDTEAGDVLPAARLAVAFNVPGDTGAALDLALREGAQLLTGYAPTLCNSSNPAIEETVIDIDSD